MKEVKELSLGYCGKCKLIMRDENVVHYAYSGENWNDSNSIVGDIDMLDGELIIYKRCLEEPEVHVRVKRLPSGKKSAFKKRVIHIPAIRQHIANGDIIIEKKCENEFQRVGTSEGDCYLADMLLLKIFEAYQRDGVLPSEKSFLQ